MIYLISYEKISSRKRQFHKLVIKSEVSIYVTIAALYCGTGAADVGKMSAFLGLPGTRSFNSSLTTLMTSMIILLLLQTLWLKRVSERKLQ